MKVILHRLERMGYRWGGQMDATWQALNDYDLIWVPFYNINVGSLSLYRTLRGVRTPVLFTIHDVHPVFYPTDWAGESLGRFWQEMVPFAQASRQLITHTRYQKEVITRHLGVAAEKVAVTPVPPVIDPEVLLQRFERGQVEETLAGFGIRGRYALYPGSTTNMHKNHARLILAWAELKGRMGAACPMLVCTAKGHRWGELKQLIESLGLAGTVVFSDTVQTQTLALLLQEAALVIVPTLYEGGGSGPVTDACLVGKPVVCARIRPIEEQLEYFGGGYAEYFDPESVLAIADAAQSAWERLEGLEQRARENQRRLMERLPQFWGEWTRFYSQTMRATAAAEELKQQTL